MSHSEISNDLWYFLLPWNNVNRLFTVCCWVSLACLHQNLFLRCIFVLYSIQKPWSITDERTDWMKYRKEKLVKDVTRAWVVSSMKVSKMLHLWQISLNRSEFSIRKKMLLKWYNLINNWFPKNYSVTALIRWIELMENKALFHSILLSFSLRLSVIKIELVRCSNFTQIAIDTNFKSS